jgi:predicted amidohydrolase YtcJ
MYARLSDQGKVVQRSRFCFLWQNNDATIWPGGQAAIEKAISLRQLYARDEYKLECIKIMLDGVPGDSHTAAMLEPYIGKSKVDDPDAVYGRGLLLMNQQDLNQALERFDRAGFSVKMHCSGDACARAAINAIEYAREKNGVGGQRHEVTHSVFVAPEDIARAKGVAATFEVSPFLWYSTPITEGIAASVGPERFGRVWPIRDFLDSGALVVSGADWPVVQNVNPWDGIEAMITREVPGGSEEKVAAEQAITLEEAIDIFTINAAIHFGHGNSLGSIEVGKIADVVVLDQNPFKVDTYEIHNTKVDLVYVNGKVVHRREQ